jgi:hypothetical protein
MPRLKLALNRPERNVDVIAYARHIASRLDGNPYFPALPVPIATLLGHIDDLEAAEAAVLSGTHGTATVRDAKLEVVVLDLEQEKTYVETVASQRGEDALAVAASSGFDTKQSRGPRKWAFEVEQSDRSGEVKLYAPRVNRAASYKWQRSTDGTLWIDLPDTNVASAVASGLSPGTLYFFRYRTLLRNVLGDWSDPVTFRVT